MKLQWSAQGNSTGGSSIGASDVNPGVNEVNAFCKSRQEQPMGLSPYGTEG